MVGALTANAVYSSMIIPNMGNNPDWIFYRDDKPSEAEVMPRLIAEFPVFRPRWEKHLEFWKGEPAGSYNVAQFVHFVVQTFTQTATLKTFNARSI